MDTQADVAIFLDLDNLLIGAREVRLPFDIELIVEHIRELTSGRIVLRQAYGDWRQHSKISEALARAGFGLQAVVRLGTMSKNLADMQMVVDTLDTLIDGYQIDTYVLITGDRDFLPLVQTLRKRSKTVIGMGIEHTTSNTLASLCDQYIYYDELIKDTPAKQQIKMSALIERSLNQLTQQRERVPASVLRQKMEELSQGTFPPPGPQKLRFRDLLEAHEDIVATHWEGTTLYVAHANHDDNDEAQAPTDNPDPAPTNDNLPDIETLLQTVLTDLQSSNEPIEAGYFKQALESAGQHLRSRPWQKQQFTKFLAQYDHIITIIRDESAVFIQHHDHQPDDDDTANHTTTTNSLAKEYRSHLKKAGLRVIPNEARLFILQTVVNKLQHPQDMTWKELINHVINHKKEKQPDLKISRNFVNDVLRLAQRAEVIKLADKKPSLGNTPVKLTPSANGHLFQEAVMRCDACYLMELDNLKTELDWEEASIALYENSDRGRYLRIVKQRFAQNNQSK
ncbi:MAG TPA: NYN domain-containing protein [Anaerolineae bacterium]|nr:NYN domain-containing protein [Anaerolineae bacterium]